MHTKKLPTVCFVLLLGHLTFAAGCGPKEPPPPNEYIKFRYTHKPGDTKEVTLPIPDATLPCGRMDKVIKVRAEQGKTSVEITLRDVATKPAQWIANTATSGKINLDVVIPNGASGTVGFGSGDQNDNFTCLLNVLPPDPFSVFDAKFTCDSKVTAGGELFIRDGLVHATMCTPQ